MRQPTSPPKSKSPSQARSPIKFASAVALALASLGGAGLGISAAMRSSLFVVRVVEIADLPESSPLDAEAITRLAAVPVDRASLFVLDVAAIEARLLSNPWVREARIQKRLPQTVSISVVFREPVALLQSESGSLSYVDSDGKIFGRVDLKLAPDLPVLSGIPAGPSKGPNEKVLQALAIAQSWTKAKLDRAAALSSVTFDAERGFRALVSYAVGETRARAMVDIGHEFDGETDAQFDRLRQVFRYLAEHGISARQIWADSGKKIVVKIARRS